MLTFTVDSPMAEMDALRASSRSPLTPQSMNSFESISSQETGYTSLIKHVPNSPPWGMDLEQLLIDFCGFLTLAI